jgi:hypothetical protein
MENIRGYTTLALVTVADTRGWFAHAGEAFTRVNIALGPAERPSVCVDLGAVCPIGTAPAGSPSLDFDQRINARIGDEQMRAVHLQYHTPVLI